MKEAAAITMVWYGIVMQTNQSMTTKAFLPLRKTFKGLIAPWI
jgi:hypothetical protein